MKGTIKRVTDKGFGFMEVEGYDKDIFFHASALEGAMFNELQEGDVMECDVTEGDKGLSAINVRPA